MNQHWQEKLSTKWIQNRHLTQFEVCRELTQDFSLCFEGVIVWGHSDDSRRGGFNNCGADRRQMKWTDFQEETGHVELQSCYFCLHHTEGTFLYTSLSAIAAISSKKETFPSLWQLKYQQGTLAFQHVIYHCSCQVYGYVGRVFTRHTRTAGAGRSLHAGRRLWRPLLIERAHPILQHQNLTR